MSYHPNQTNSAHTFTSPTRRRLPFHPYTPARAWNSAMGRSHALHHPIAFDYVGAARWQGVSMRDLRLRGNTTPIQGATDTVLAHTGVQRVVFRIQWPGYGHIEWCRNISVVTPNSQPITRVALAVQIASNFVRFCEKTEYETPTSKDWMVDPSCVRFEHLYLIALHNTFENVWQADIALDIC